MLLVWTAYRRFSACSFAVQLVAVATCKVLCNHTWCRMRGSEKPVSFANATKSLMYSAPAMHSPQITCANRRVDTLRLVQLIRAGINLHKSM